MPLGGVGKWVFIRQDPDREMPDYDIRYIDDAIVQCAERQQGYSSNLEKHFQNSLKIPRHSFITDLHSIKMLI